jgi:lysozyme
MARQISEDALHAISQREGLRLDAYEDTGGTWTIGYGHTKGVKQGDKITQEQALAYLQADIARAEDCVSKSVTVQLSDNQYGALVSFAYNIGCDAFCKSTLVKKLNEGDYESVHKEMFRWIYVNKIPSDGLINRRKSEIGQWVKGEFVSSASITPDEPAPWWKEFLKAAHTRLQALGLFITSTVLSLNGNDLKDAGTQLQGYASMWHSLAWIGVGLCVSGVAFELYRKAKG